MKWQIEAVRDPDTGWIPGPVVAHREGWPVGIYTQDVVEFRPGRRRVVIVADLAEPLGRLLAGWIARDVERSVAALNAQLQLPESA